MTSLSHLFDDTPAVQTWHDVDRAVFEQKIKPLNQPAVLKGLVNDWPICRHAKSSNEALCDFLSSLSLEKKLQSFSAPPESNGFFTYSSDIKSFNFERHSETLRELLKALQLGQHASGAAYYYAGAINIPEHLPQFLTTHSLSLLDQNTEKLISLWIGNQSRVPAHWDLPHNIACVVHGRRRFIVFPTEQIPNMYIGPLDVTIAGQPSSLVDFHNVNLQHYPRFEHAVQHAQIAELEPGDAIYIPSLWLHHVESLNDLGALVNFWWRDGKTQRFTPLLTLMHGLLSIRDLPASERKAWKAVFDYYLFDYDENELSHIPKNARSVLGDLDTTQENNLRRFLANRLVMTAGSRNDEQ